MAPRPALAPGITGESELDAETGSVVSVAPGTLDDPDDDVREIRMTTIDRATCREETRVYTAWCIGATFVLIAAVQCVSWVAHAVR